MHSLKVLIVDDERLSRKRLRACWGTIRNWSAGECETGRQALEFLSDRRADLLFLDIQMPGMDGFSFLRCLEERGGLNACGLNHGPFTIFVSAHDNSLSARSRCMRSTIF